MCGRLSHATTIERACKDHLTTVVTALTKHPSPNQGVRTPMTSQSEVPTHPTQEAGRSLPSK